MILFDAAIFGLIVVAVLSCLALDRFIASHETGTVKESDREERTENSLKLP
jgi:hypothetical protein